MRKAEQIVRDLVDGVKEFDAQFKLIREIDKEIVSPQRDIPKAFETVAAQVRDLARADRMGVFLVGDDLKPFDIDRGHHGEVVFIPRGTKIQIEDAVKFYEFWPNGERICTLTIPVKWQNTVLVVIVIQDSHPAMATYLADGDFITYCEGIANQLSALLQSRIEADIQSARSQLIKDFFEHQLRPAACWAAIAKGISSFLPTWMPAALGGEARVQLLTYQPGDLYLHLCADDQTGCSQTIRPVPLRIDQTVSGILVENIGEGNDYLMIDPNSRKDRYQSYLFCHDVPHSELVLAVHHDEKLVGVINVEHKNVNAFTKFHIAILRDAAKFLGPFIDALILKEERQRDVERGYQYVQAKFLTRMAHIFRHKVGSAILEGRFAIENIERSYVNAGHADGVVNRDIEIIRSAIDQFNERTTNFLTDLPRYAVCADVDVVDTVKMAISEFSMTAKRDNILINLNNQVGDKRLVWASRLLREHIYDMVNNSIQAIQDRIRNEAAFIGNVSIVISREEVKDLLNRETSAPRIIICISDNGGGVPVEIESRIRDFGFSTKRDKGGTGYGLPAAIEFVQSMGGDLTYSNKCGEGFSVMMTLLEYQSDYHDSKKKKLPSFSMMEA